MGHFYGFLWSSMGHCPGTTMSCYGFLWSATVCYGPLLWATAMGCYGQLLWTTMGHYELLWASDLIYILNMTGHPLTLFQMLNSN